MKLLVCGSEGSLMSHVIQQLTGIVTDWEVYGVDTCERYGSRSHLNHIIGDRYTFIQMDLCDARDTRTLINTIQPDVIIQGAAKIYGVGGFNRYRADILGDDIALHRNVLSAALEAGTDRVMFISSSMVYESVEDRIPVYEDMVWDDNYPTPKTDYGLSKLTNERLSLAYKDQYNLDYTIFRPFNILTPYEKAGRTMGDSHVFSDFINKLIFEDSSSLPVYGDGQQVRTFTWIDDVAAKIAACVVLDDYYNTSQNEIFNLGGNKSITMLELAEKIHRIGLEEKRRSKPIVQFEFRPAFVNDVKYRVPDIKAASSINWFPLTDIEDMIRECVRKCPRQFITGTSSYSQIDTHSFDPNIIMNESFMIGDEK
jgi:UDP-glucose 4-epimerase